MGVLAVWRRRYPISAAMCWRNRTASEGGRQGESRLHAKPVTNAAKVLKSTMSTLAKDMVNIAPIADR
jgi:hypothetical protein